MATIAESFLDDLNDLEDESSSEDENQQEEEKMDVEMSKEHLRAQETFISHMKNVTSALEVRFQFFFKECLSTTLKSCIVQRCVCFECVRVYLDVLCIIFWFVE